MTQKHTKPKMTLCRWLYEHSNPVAERLLRDFQSSYDEIQNLTPAPEAANDLLEALRDTLDFIKEGYSNKAQFNVDYAKHLAAIEAAEGK